MTATAKMQVYRPAGAELKALGAVLTAASRLCEVIDRADPAVQDETFRHHLQGLRWAAGQVENMLECEIGPSVRTGRPARSHT